MKDSLDNIIYVGKSKNLKSRVASYFYNSKSHSPKVQKLVKNLKDFDYILTDTEFEAFILECRLIKEIKPRYNRLMKSTNCYVFIRLKVNVEYPDIEITSECNKEDGCLYYGPYTNRSTVERGINGIKECLKILCNNSTRKASSCLYYSLEQCIGMCLKDTPSDEYLAIFDNILMLLNGRDNKIIDLIQDKMNSASEKFDFEAAAKYRDYLTAVDYIVNKAKVIEYTEKNKNIVILEPLENQIIKYYLIKGNKVLFSEKYTLTASNHNELKAMLLKNIMLYFKDKALETSLKISKEDVDEAQIIYSYLKSQFTNCSHAIIKKSWLSTPNNINMDKALDKLIKTQEDITN